MKVKVNGTKFKVSIIGTMSNEMNDAFATELRVFYAKFGKFVKSVEIDASGKAHYVMTVVATNGTSERVTFSTTNGNTAGVYIKYANAFMKNVMA